MQNSDNSTPQKGDGVPRLRDISADSWKTIGKEIGRCLIGDNVPIISAGVAFFFFLAVFPALAAAVSVYGLVQDPAQVQEQLENVKGLVPGKGYEIIASTLEEKASDSDSKLGWGVLLAIVFGVWSAKKGVNAVFKGINIAYREKEKRGFIRNNLLILAFTLGGIIFALITLTLVAVFPALLGKLAWLTQWEGVVSVCRWILLVLLAMLALATVYRIAPERPAPKFRFITPGSLIATTLWVLGSMLFSWYVKSFGNFDKTYGGFAAVIVLMLWFYLSAFIILLGAETNARIEQIARARSADG